MNVHSKNRIVIEKESDGSWSIDTGDVGHKGLSLSQVRETAVASIAKVDLFAWAQPTTEPTTEIKLIRSSGTGLWFGYDPTGVVRVVLEGVPEVAATSVGSIRFQGGFKLEEGADDKDDEGDDAPPSETDADDQCSIGCDGPDNTEWRRARAMEFAIEATKGLHISAAIEAAIKIESFLKGETK